jgi:hypothetical protein
MSTSSASLGIREGLPHAREQLADTAHTMKDTARAKLGQIKRHLNKGKGVARAKAEEVTQQATSLASQAREQVPDAAAGRLNHLTQAVRRRPVPTAALALTLCALLLLPRQFRRAEG